MGLCNPALIKEMELSLPFDFLVLFFFFIDVIVNLDIKIVVFNKTFICNE